MSIELLVNEWTEAGESTDQAVRVTDAGFRVVFTLHAGPSFSVAKRELREALSFYDRNPSTPTHPGASYSR